jgi:hypothetical protein
MARKPTDYTSFGIDARPTSTLWSEIIRGPTNAEVRAHIAKLASFLEHLRSKP